MNFSVRQLFCLIVTGFSFFVSGSATAQQTQEVKTEVKAVTVFLNRAQVTSTSSATVPAGVTELVLSNIPASLDVNSLQISATGPVTIYEVVHNPNYLQTGAKPRGMKMLEDSVQTYQDRLRALTDQKEVYQKEEGLMLANQSIGGQSGVDADDLLDVADVFRSRMLLIKANIYKTEKQIAKVTETYNQFFRQLQTLQQSYRNATGQVVVKVQADSRATVNLEASYVVHNAGWKPVYDLRATDTNSPIKLNYRAEVFQNTGINWNNVALTLSTTNTTIGAQKPDLQPYYLNIYDRPRRVMYAQPQQESYAVDAAPMDYEQIQKLPTREKSSISVRGSRSAGTYTAPAGSIAQQIDAVNLNLSVEFRLKVPYTIPSDNKMHLVDIQQNTLPTTYAFSTAPKLQSEVFLVAHLTNWDAFNLLPGEANVFFEGTFTGKSYINPLETSDTLQISLGRDKKVIVERQKLKDLKTKGFLGSNTTETRGFEITIRNTKTSPIEVTIEDQIPISTNSQVEVAAQELSGGGMNKTTGKVTWKLKLNPNETKELQLKYSVKYPKSLQVGLVE